MNQIWDRHDRRLLKGDADRRRERCPNCGLETSLVHRDRRRVWPELSENLAPPFSEHVMEDVWTCLSCDKTVVRLSMFTESEEQDRDPFEVLTAWPRIPPKNLDDSVPEEIRSFFREASTCEGVRALRGAAALYRAAVEALVRDQGLREGTLEQRVDKLTEQGVDSEIVRDLHDARLTGNWSLHEGVTFSAEEVEDLANLIEQAVDFLYVTPARRQAMRDDREAKRQKRRI